MCIFEERGAQERVPQMQSFSGEKVVGIFKE